MQSIKDLLMGVAVIKRNEVLAECTGDGSYANLAPEDRPDRELVAPGCLLKPFDEVEIYGSPHIYLCPGGGVGWMHTITIDGATIPLGQYEASTVTDRIPADPLETPMPIFPEPP